MWTSFGFRNFDLFLSFWFFSPCFRVLGSSATTKRRRNKSEGEKENGEQEWGREKRLGGSNVFSEPAAYFLVSDREEENAPTREADNRVLGHDPSPATRQQRRSVPDIVLYLRTTDILRDRLVDLGRTRSSLRAMLGVEGSSGEAVESREGLWGLICSAYRTRSFLVSF